VTVMVCLYGRVNVTGSLINAHVYPPQCVPSVRQDPPRCSCGGAAISDCPVLPLTPGLLMSTKTYVVPGTYACYDESKCVGVC